ncbi:hypothetical protein MtrunA17_Chr1g0211441 [Medicago truncatula]|uniref:Uncharacterized protein n=1 Tax=Medicago truncatula TaxID=3880 RepID=A0A396K402_MEDTR|nr:hypothetical protein MtrunA17_Chr1g0211441 [Medicago truncatula]
MLTLAVENSDAASHGIFNCAAGRPVNIVHYDPESIGIDAKKAFPFRNMVLVSFFLNKYGISILSFIIHYNLFELMNSCKENFTNYLQCFA